MSVFDFPRINIKGLVMVNVGTANNDDYSIAQAGSNTYSGYTTPPGNSQVVPNFGQSLRLANSATVQPYNFKKPGTTQDMTDAELVSWMQNPQDFAWWNNTPSPSPSKMIPGEWNLFGNMSLAMTTQVVGVTVPNSGAPTGTQVYTSNDPLGVIGGNISFNNSVGRTTAMLIDVNPEAPPASQVFSDFLTLQGPDKSVLFSGKPSKASTRWINFQRNTYLNGPNGAAGTFQCFVPASAISSAFMSKLQPYLDRTRNFTGMVFRYTMFRSLQPINYFNHFTKSNTGPWNTPPKPDWNAAIVKLYQGNSSVTPALNPSYVQISGTIAPSYAGELQSMMNGSYMAPSASNYFNSPGGNTGPAPNNQFSLAPAMVNRQNSAVVSVDLTAALPEVYSDPGNKFDPNVTNTNTKYNGMGTLQFGTITNGNNFSPIGQINYSGAYSAYGDAAGWIFDFKKGVLPAGASYALNASNTVPQGGGTPVSGNLLLEQKDYFISDQPGIFVEQGFTPTNPNWVQNMPKLPLTTNIVSSQGYQDTTASFNRYTFGALNNTGTYDVWMFNISYVMPPAQSPNPVKIVANYTPGTPISIPTGTAGVFIITITATGFTPTTVPNPGSNMMTAPMINCRILPNNPSNNPGNADYSNYYTFDSNGNPVATTALNWNVLYTQVFRNYYLLYPGMSNIVPMNDPNQWIGPNLFGLLDRVSTSAWNSMSNMPRTRDLSATRRWLIIAYCNKFANQSPPANQH